MEQKHSYNREYEIISKLLNIKINKTKIQKNKIAKLSNLKKIISQHIFPKTKNCKNITKQQITDRSLSGVKGWKIN